MSRKLLEYKKIGPVQPWRFSNSTSWFLQFTDLIPFGNFEVSILIYFRELHLSYKKLDVTFSKPVPHVQKHSGGAVKTWRVHAPNVNWLNQKTRQSVQTNLNASSAKQRGKKLATHGSLKMVVQYHSKVSYHLSSRFLRDESLVSRYESLVSREPLMRIFWNKLQAVSLRENN